MNFSQYLTESKKSTANLFQTYIDSGFDFKAMQKAYKSNKKGKKLVLATKGDLLDQERKLERSGLTKCFHHIEIMSNKKDCRVKF